MRVITGSRKGHTLKAPKGDNTRPTSDKVKESLFNIIGYIDEEDTVLDLFSGSGGVGIEFLSRGAKSCYFVDENASSIKVIKENLEKTKLLEKSFVYKSDVEKSLKLLSGEKRVFDFIFLDPPYNKDLVLDTLNLIANEELLEKNGFIIIEHESKLELPEEVSSLTKTDCRKYGDTVISFYKKREEDDDSNISR